MLTNEFKYQSSWIIWHIDEYPTPPMCIISIPVYPPLTTLFIDAYMHHQTWQRNLLLEIIYIQGTSAKSSDHPFALMLSEVEIHFEPYHHWIWNIDVHDCQHNSLPHFLLNMTVMWISTFYLLLALMYWYKMYTEGLWGWFHITVSMKACMKVDHNLHVQSQPNDWRLKMVFSNGIFLKKYFAFG